MEWESEQKKTSRIEKRISIKQRRKRENKITSIQCKQVQKNFYWFYIEIVFTVASLQLSSPFSDQVSRWFVDCRILWNFFFLCLFYFFHFQILSCHRTCCRSGVVVPVWPLLLILLLSNTVLIIFCFF